MTNTPIRHESPWAAGLPKANDKAKAKPKTGTRTAVNRAIARTLRKQGCDPVALLARIANDEELPMALRFRAANTLAKLAYAHVPEPPPAPEPEEPAVDVAAIIAKAWEKPKVE